MIKCDVKVHGTINRAAEVRKNSEGVTFVVFGLSVEVPSTKGKPSPLQFNVFVETTDTQNFRVGRQVSIDGILHIKGAPERKITYNLRAAHIAFDTNAASGVTGTTHFRGTVSKDVVTPLAKNGKRYLRFSGYSTDKIKEEFCSVFVRFVYFGDQVPVFVVPRAKIEIHGDLRLSTFNGKIDINSKITKLNPVEPQTGRTDVR